MVVGGSGTGKSRGFAEPNLKSAKGSYVISDPKGALYKKYAKYLEQKGYVVKLLDFTDPDNSVHYNFFNYIRDSTDVIKIAHMLMQQDKNIRTDPF